VSADKIESFSFTFSNDLGEKVVAGFDKPNNNYFIDRSSSGKVDFEKGFAQRHTAPRLSTDQKLQLTIVVDNASMELFGDEGLSCMTSVFFPNKILSNIQIQSENDFVIKSLQLTRLKSIWR
jgi:fructan beta-fructosidase